MYKNNNTSYNGVIAALIMIISPLLALPYILVGIYYRKKSSFFFFSIFLGLLAWLQLPLADLFRHTMSFDAYAGVSFQTMLSAQTDPDFIIPILNWILVTNNIPYQYLRLFELTESFFLLTIVFNYMIDNSPVRYSRKEIFTRFIILFLFFEFIQTVSGVRYGFALYQYIFALHLFINKRSYLWAALFAYLSMKIHNSFTFIIPVSLLLYEVCISKKVSVIVFVIFLFLVGPIIAKFSYLWDSRAEWYFNGGNSVASFDGTTLNGFILFLLPRIFLSPFAYLLLKYYQPKSGWHRIGMAWLILIGIFITNEVMIFRTAFVFAAIGTFILLSTDQYIPSQNIKKRITRIIVYCGCIITLCNTINYRSIIFNSRFQYIAYNIPAILYNQYDKYWILRHIDENTYKE